MGKLRGKNGGLGLGQEKEKGREKILFFNNDININFSFYKKN